MNNFWRSLEIPLISLPSTKLDWKFEITNAKLQVPIVTLSTTDSVNLTKQLSEGFKRSVYWNSYETKPTKVIEKGKKPVRTT